MKSPRFCSFVACAALLAYATAQAQDVKVSTAAQGLDNPCGVAVQPGTGHVFVSDSGALRVLRVDVAGKKVDNAITGFPKDVYGKGPMYDIGPLGLAFLDENTLVVGDGGLPDGEELMRTYTVPAPGTSIKADQMKQKLGPIGPGDESAKGEGNFYGVAVGSRAIYITCNGDDTKGWVSKIDLVNGQPTKLEPFIATKVATNVDAPVGITMDSQGRIVVGQMGEINLPHDSLLTIYDAASGQMLYNATTGLYDIAALAYSPASGKLYALDFAWMDEKQGGLFRLDTKIEGDKLTVNAVKVLELDKPTAMAFAPDGTLYVTVFGTAQEGSDVKPGKLLKITGGL